MLYAIDYFTREELLHMNYAILSSKLSNQGGSDNVSKISYLYPDVDIVTEYAEYKDQDILDKMYFQMLRSDRELDVHHISGIESIIYKTFVNPILNHSDITIICDEIENPYVTSLCRYLKKYYELEVIDLNKLFTEGAVGDIYLDLNKVNDKAVDLRITALKEMYRTYSTTREGRMKIMTMMSLTEKMKLLKHLGIKCPKGSSMRKINEILMTEWVDDADEDDE